MQETILTDMKLFVKIISNNQFFSLLNKISRWILKDSYLTGWYLVLNIFACRWPGRWRPKFRIYSQFVFVRRNCHKITVVRRTGECYKVSDGFIVVTFYPVFSENNSSFMSVSITWGSNHLSSGPALTLDILFSWTSLVIVGFCTKLPETLVVVGATYATKFWVKNSPAIIHFKSFWNKQCSLLKRKFKPYKKPC